MSNLISDPNTKTSILDAAADLRENINYIEKLRLFPSVAKYINSQHIFNDIHINDLTIASNIKLNLYVFHCLESYQLSQSFVVDYILEIFYEEFYG